MKVRLRIHTETGIKIKKCKVSEDGTYLIVRKGSKKKAEWKPKIGTLEIKHGFFRPSYWTEAFPDAPKTWTINPAVETTNMPKWDKQTSHNFIEAKMIQKAGEEPKEKPGTAILWVIAIIGIANILITLFASGRIKFG